MVDRKEDTMSIENVDGDTRRTLIVELMLKYEPEAAKELLKDYIMENWWPKLEIATYYSLLEKAEKRRDERGKTGV